MSQLLGKDLDTTVAKFHFLCSVPTCDIPPPPATDQCAICRDPYTLNDWQLGGYVHRPVILPCGHLLGLQCLARWITSNSSVNTCPLCRTILVNPPTMTRDQLRGPIASAFARLETVAVVESNGISKSQRERLFEALWEDLRRQRELRGWKDGGERIMVAWEEFFNTLCVHTPEEFVRSPDPPRVVRIAPAAPVNPHLNLHRRALARLHVRAIRAPVHGDGRITFSIRQVQVALFVAMVGVTYAPSAYIYDLETGRRDTFTALLLSTATWFISLVAALNIVEAGGVLNENFVIPMLGPLVGLALGVGVRRFDVLIHKWWMKGMVDVLFPRY